MVVDPASATTGARFRVRVLAIENLGNEEIAICGIDEVRLAFRGGRPLGVVAGDEVTLSAHAEHLALFDAESGQRLDWAGGGSGAPGAATDPGRCAG